MQQTNVPFKVALGYIIVAIVLILAIGLVYRNTTTVLAINQATRDYIEKRQAADSTMSNLRGMPFGVKSLEKRQAELVQKLFPDGNHGMGINATRLVVKACELRILDIDHLQADEE